MEASHALLVKVDIAPNNVLFAGKHLSATNHLPEIILNFPQISFYM
jgi:hypothetical protein